jgi:hypothetical protein
MRQKKKDPQKLKGQRADAAGAEKAIAERDAMVEREYRLGTPTAEIARQSGLTRQAIEKRAKKGEWVRDLLPAVQAKIKDMLVRDAAPEGAATGEAVNAAVERGVGIVRGHRESLGKLKRITNMLMGTVELYLDGEIPFIPWLRASDTLPGVVARLAQAQAKVCTLERQAFSVGAGAGEDDRSKGQGPALPDWRTLFERAGLRHPEPPSPGRSDPGAG